MEIRNLSVAEAAKYLGVKERFIRRLIAEHRITYLKLGKHVRIPENSINEFEVMSLVEKSK
jgi:excisionase family DNA binding protein